MDAPSRAALDQDAAEWADMVRTRYGLDLTDETTRRACRALVQDLATCLSEACCHAHGLIAWCSIVATAGGSHVDAVQLRRPGTDS